ncbi:Hypp2703 [Branchiostoma lanceolatum]|uniref:Hypp2703 protein n=1 Tax=Branchiostoma lanceolatum TaxID=7740 RepID=A0A8K0ERB2_BRALA|nr:Hypp2703 [Branchiostoma lanceolatum]
MMAVSCFLSTLTVAILTTVATGPYTLEAHAETGGDEVDTTLQVRVGKNKVDVSLGGSVVLPCNYSVPSDDVQPLVSWWKDRGPVLTRRIVYEHQAARFSKGYGGWAGRTALVGQSSLEMFNITTDDEGRYECEVRVPLVYGAARDYILLSVLDGEHGKEGTEPHSRKVVIATIAGVCCLLLVVLAVTIVSLHYKRRLKGSSAGQLSDDGETSHA